MEAPKESDVQTPRAGWGRYPGDSPFAPKVCASWAAAFCDSHEADQSPSQPQSMQRSKTEEQSLGLRPQYPILLPVAASWDSVADCTAKRDGLTDSPTGKFPMSSLEQPRTKRNVGAPQQAQLMRIEWRVPAKELQSMNRQVVSRLFELPGPMQVKMILSPPVSCESRGGASFKKCKGKDLKLELKCEEGQETVGSLKLSFFMGIQHGSVENRASDDKRGPFVHDFSDCSVAGLPKDVPGWSFDLKTLTREHQVVCGVEFSEVLSL